ncbi:GNAT family N-acetyltransferase, partial [Patulibacter sp. S7RM1-6]
MRARCVGTGGEARGEELCPEANLAAALPGRDGAVLLALAAHLERERDWDELRIEGARREDVAPLLDRWPTDRIVVKERPSYQYDLGALAPDADVPSALPGGPRRRARASLRALAARGELAVDWATDRDEAAAYLEELVALHQRAWTAVGEPGLFGGTAFAAFHRRLAPELVAAGRATLVRVRCGDETIGVLYGFRDGDRLLAYQSGLRRFDDNRLRPGIVSHLLAMEAARERGIAVYDHLAGEARYKRELSTATTPSRSWALRRPRARLAAYDLAREL